MAENSPDNPKRRSGFAEILNTPAGVTLLGFFLTGVLGALVSFSVNWFQRWDQERVATLTERENEIRAVNREFVGAIVQRAFYTDAAIEAITLSKTGADLETVWPRYENAFQAEMAAVWQNHLNIEGHLEDDPAPTGQSGWQPFWYYLDLVIQPRFEEMDHCLRSAHGAYLSTGGAQPERMKEAGRVFQGCEASYRWDHVKPKQDASVAQWDHFKTCLESFTYHLDLAARIQQQVWKAGEQSVSLPDPARCNRDDLVCQQARFLIGLEDSIAGDCGPCLRVIMSEHGAGGVMSEHGAGGVPLQNPLSFPRKRWRSGCIAPGFREGDGSIRTVTTNHVVIPAKSVVPTSGKSTPTCHSRESGNPAPATVREDALTLVRTLRYWQALGPRFRGDDNLSRG